MLCCKKYEVAPPEEIDLTPGDLVFFSGRGVGSYIIRAASFSTFSHVGIVCRSATTRRLMLLESGGHYTDGLVDAKSGHLLKSGVRMVPLGERLVRCGVPIYARVLNKNERPLVKTVLETFQVKFTLTPYEKSFATMINSVFHFRAEQGDMQTVFCSELVAEFFREIHYLPREIAASWYSPAALAKAMPDKYSPIRRYYVAESNK